MIGAIIGDIVGSRFEFNPTNAYDFKFFDKACAFTDDTICTIGIADAILKGVDFGSSLHAWCQRYPHPMGAYGGRFNVWVHSSHPEPYGSFGNGSAMRVSPVAWAYADRKEMLQKAAESASCTHNHPEGIKGAQTVALGIFKALQERVINDYKPLNKSQIDLVINKCVEHSGYNIQIEKKAVQNEFDETCQGTVPVALWIISQSTDFEDAVRRAVSLGADADTLGAIVGSMAEAIWGIPPEMLEMAMRYLPPEMKKVVLEFYDRYANVSQMKYYEALRKSRFVADSFTILKADGTEDRC